MNNLHGVGLKSFVFAATDPLSCLEQLGPLLHDANPKNFCDNQQVNIRLKQLKSQSAPQFNFWNAIVRATKESPANRVKKFTELIKQG